MPTYIIGYDIKKDPSESSNAQLRLADEIRAMFGTRWRYGEATWLVKSDLRASEIAERLFAVMDPNDMLLVFALTGEASWTGLSDRATEWLKKNL